MRTLYPEIEPFNKFRLQVSDIHNINVEECGNPNGVPVVFFHGGPGGGINENYRRFFDPKHYHIVLFDQRGAGLSTPHAELKENTTWDLVADAEKIREKLNIKKWHVFGGSWGSTLALSYAVTHPDRVLSLCLRGIFLCRKKEIDWFYQKGASFIYPDTWEKYVNHIPENEHHDFVKAYHKRLTSDDKNVRVEAARIWSTWEASASKLVPDKNLVEDFDDAEFAIAFARIECHYFTNRAFFETDNYLIEKSHVLKNIPTEIVHGRYDVVCPIENAWELKKAMPHAILHITTAGHAASETENTHHLIEIMDKFRSIKG